MHSRSHGPGRGTPGSNRPAVSFGIKGATGSGSAGTGEPVTNAGPPACQYAGTSPPLTRRAAAIHPLRQRTWTRGGCCGGHCQRRSRPAPWTTTYWRLDGSGRCQQQEGVGRQTATRPARQGGATAAAGAGWPGRDALSRPPSDETASTLAMLWGLEYSGSSQRERSTGWQLVIAVQTAALSCSVQLDD